MYVYQRDQNVYFTYTTSYGLFEPIIIVPKHMGFDKTVLGHAQMRRSQVQLHR